MRFEYSAGIIVYKNEGSQRLFLFLGRDRNSWWEFPKGHIEKEEHQYEAAMRETKEETGLDVKITSSFRKRIRYFFFDGKERVGKTVVYFLAQAGNQKIKISHEHSGYKWMSFSEAMKTLKFKNVRECIKEAQEYVEKEEKIRDINRRYSKLPSRAKNWQLGTNFVAGEGPVNAKIAFIGQAPGEWEHKTGRPFIGRSGKLLSEMMKDAGINRKSVYITSTVQFFPPKNRMPSREEIEICLPFLKEQLDIIKPEYIVMLGNVASKALLGIENMNENRGKIIVKDGIKYMPTFHPAAILRFNKFRPAMQKDFQRLREELKKAKE